MSICQLLVLPDPNLCFQVACKTVLVFCLKETVVRNGNHLMSLPAPKNGQRPVGIIWEHSQRGDKDAQMAAAIKLRNLGCGHPRKSLTATGWCDIYSLVACTAGSDFIDENHDTGRIKTYFPRPTRRSPSVPCDIGSLEKI